jgi:hypothetical protein
MSEPRQYKQTLFDRRGPDAGNWLKAVSFGAAIGTVSFFMFLLIGQRFLHLNFLLAFLFALCCSLGVGALPLYITEATGNAIHQVFTSGDSTPYIQQHSYQQALVMQGRVDEALASMEAMIAEPGSTVAELIRTAELYSREAQQHQRAAELFRSAIGRPDCTVGEEVYSANRLVDLLTGPLEQPGRALVELRRLCDRYPDSTIGQNARAALKTLKEIEFKRQASLGQS